jgi:hypothetical protein
MNDIIKLIIKNKIEEFGLKDMFHVYMNFCHDLDMGEYGTLNTSDTCYISKNDDNTVAGIIIDNDNVGADIKLYMHVPYDISWFNIKHEIRKHNINNILND